MNTYRNYNSQRGALSYKSYEKFCKSYLEVNASCLEPAKGLYYIEDCLCTKPRFNSCTPRLLKDKAEAIFNELPDFVNTDVKVLQQLYIQKFNALSDAFVDSGYIANAIYI